MNVEQIIDFLEGRTESRHAEDCMECHQRVEEWRQLHLHLHRSQLTDAPAAVLNAAYGILGPRPRIGQVLATLIFDSFSQPAFAGARGAGAPRQLVLRVAEFDIHIRISGTTENRQITGQVMPRADSGLGYLTKVQLLQNGRSIQSAELDSLGEFEFENTPDGLLSLKIDLPNQTVIGALGNEEVV